MLRKYSYNKAIQKHIIEFKQRSYRDLPTITIHNSKRKERNAIGNTF